MSKNKYLAIFYLVILLPAKIEAITNIIDLLDIATEEKATFCQPGLSYFKYTIRSFDGNLCKTELGALIAVGICGSVPGFRDSKCYQRAEKLNIKNTDRAREKLVDMMARDNSKFANLCKLVKKILNKISCN